MTCATPLREDSGVQDIVEVDAPEGFLRTGLLDGRAEATEDIVDRAERRIIKSVNVIECHAANHHFRIGAHRRSSTNRDDTAVAFIGKQEIEARASHKPSRPKDRRGSCHLPHQNRVPSSSVCYPEQPGERRLDRDHAVLPQVSAGLRVCQSVAC